MDADWASYSRQSYGLQWGRSERIKHATARRAPSVRRLMRPGKVSITWPNGWPGWHVDVATRW